MNGDTNSVLIDKFTNPVSKFAMIKNASKFRLIACSSIDTLPPGKKSDNIIIPNVCRFEANMKVTYVRLHILREGLST